MFFAWLAATRGRDSARGDAPSAAPGDAPPGLENLLAPAPRVLSGGEPQGEAAFAELARRGVKVVVSVDGARPDVAAARRHGLRYVHVPIGYDGVAGAAQGALVRVMRELETDSAVYFHCHHGKHRGPAATAVACLSAGTMTHEQALAFMKQAGTGAEYHGLWRDVANWKPLPADAPLPPLVETAEVDSLAAAMADVGRAWDELKLCRAAGWRTPTDHPDLAPAHAALLAWEGLRESRRAAASAAPAAKPRGDRRDSAQLLAGFDAALRDAAALRKALAANDRTAADAAFGRTDAGCAACHAAHRN